MKRYCAQCGAAIETDAAAPEAACPACGCRNDVSPAAPVSKNKSFGQDLAIGLLILVCLLLLLFLFLRPDEPLHPLVFGNLGAPAPTNPIGAVPIERPITPVLQTNLLSGSGEPGGLTNGELPGVRNTVTNVAWGSGPAPNRGSRFGTNDGFGETDGGTVAVPPGETKLDRGGISTPSPVPVLGPGDATAGTNGPMSADNGLPPNAPGPLPTPEKPGTQSPGPPVATTGGSNPDNGAPSPSDSPLPPGSSPRHGARPTSPEAVVPPLPEPVAEQSTLEMLNLSPAGTNFVFILDRPPSLTGDPRPLAARRELVRTLRRLGPGKNFYIVYTPHQDMPAPGFVPATKGNIDSLTNWIYSTRNFSQEPDPREAVQEAVKFKPDTIWIFSNGRFPANEIPEIRNANADLHATINTLDLFSREGEAALREIARENGGAFYFVPPPEKMGANETVRQEP